MKTARYNEACSLLDPQLIVIQELIRGGGESQFSYGPICEDGRSLAWVVARRTRQYPLDFARSSSFVETIERPEVEEAAQRLLTGLNYTGLMEIEFKYDSRDGRHKLLDLNPRVWGWHTLARAGGVEFPYLFWRLVRGQPIPNIRVEAGYRWMRLVTDLPAALSEIRRGQLIVARLFSIGTPSERACNVRRRRPDRVPLRESDAFYGALCNEIARVQTPGTESELETSRKGRLPP
jgi:predicted ATP-grasp superfamily ATP-dependent carboligase